MILRRKYECLWTMTCGGSIYKYEMATLKFLYVQAAYNQKATNQSPQRKIFCICSIWNSHLASLLLPSLRFSLQISSINELRGALQKIVRVELLEQMAILLEHLELRIALASSPQQLHLPLYKTIPSFVHYTLLMCKELKQWPQSPQLSPQENLASLQDKRPSSQLRFQHTQHTAREWLLTKALARVQVLPQLPLPQLCQPSSWLQLLQLRLLLL